ncbi:MAG: hypothetical protein NTY09_02645 [bacterium]|nr:hypothetical protein [bacterium]
MKRPLEIAVLLINAFVLAMEISVTRIFSVTMFYHFAFLAISVALFGFGASGVVLYIWKDKFSKGSLGHRLGNLAMWAGLTSVIALYIGLSVNFNPNTGIARQFIKLLVIYLSTSVPFFFAGLMLAMLFQNLSRYIARLYFLSLVGSAIGAVITIPVLSLAGGPGSIIAIAGLAFFSAVGFIKGLAPEPDDGRLDAAIQDNSKRAKIPQSRILLPVIIGIALVVLGFLNPSLKILNVTHAKGYTIDPTRILYDRWNAFSRIIVIKADDPLQHYDGGIHNWGISEIFDPANLRPQHFLQIDNTAATPIINFTGADSELEMFRDDVTAVAHYLLHDQHVLVVGPGGGKDLLAALAFHSRKIDAVEINPLVDDVMRHKFSDYNGDLYERDPITVTVGEGRTYIARSREKYDLLQISLIDTWAAASTGAYALSENNLYTIEAFEQYFSHLAPDGIFSMSRFAFNPPRETLRVASLARETLERQGVSDPGSCIMVLKQGVLANVMVRPSGFDDEAIATMEAVVDRLGFETVYMPGREPESEMGEVYTELLTTSDFKGFLESYPLDVSPTTDDRPFFFYLLPPWKFLEALALGKTYRVGLTGYNSIAIFTLVSLLLISVAVVIIFILLPLLLFKRADIRERSRPKLTLLFYFICLGLAFITIEIGLMQHFTLFLGYPIYSLVAVLTSLLLFSGFGSGWSGRIPEEKLETGIRNAVIGISIVSLIYIFILPQLFRSLIYLPDIIRVLMTIALVFPLGWFMGQPFPLGLRIIEREKLDVIPWAWGVNGAASVLGSALSLTLAIGIGYKLTLFTGVGIYIAGLIAIAGISSLKIRAVKADKSENKR